MGQETLCGESDFDYHINDEEADSMEEKDKNIPGRFEAENTQFKRNLKTERFQEPRMFTMN